MVNGKLKPPRGEEMKERLRQLDREPFADILANLIDAQPSPEELKLWAAKSPDRWGQAAAIFGKLAGYGEKIEHKIEDLRDLSDADLELKAKELTAMLGHNGGPDLRSDDES